MKKRIVSLKTIQDIASDISDWWIVFTGLLIIRFSRRSSIVMTASFERLHDFGART
jgi:hypothetical protein